MTHPSCFSPEGKLQLAGSGPESSFRLNTSRSKLSGSCQSGGRVPEKELLELHAGRDLDVSWLVKYDSWIH